MSTPIVYVTCDCHNKYEGMTKEQILAAIVQAVETGDIGDIDTGFITKIKELNANTQLQFWIGTTAEFNALASTEENTLYILSDDDTMQSLQDVRDDLDELVEEIPNILLSKVYPIGSIYMSVNNVSPSTFLGGTWEKWGEGRVPLSVDTSISSFDAPEKTGGEIEHELTLGEMPEHNHLVGDQTWYDPGRSEGGDNYIISVIEAGSGEHANAGKMPPVNHTIEYETIVDPLEDLIKIANNGGCDSHNNLQPYITCYMWKRTA